MAGERGQHIHGTGLLARWTIHILLTEVALCKHSHGSQVSFHILWPFIYLWPHTTSPDLLVTHFPIMLLLCLWPSSRIISLYPWVSLYMYLWPPLFSGTTNHKVPCLGSAHSGEFPSHYPQGCLGAGLWCCSHPLLSRASLPYRTICKRTLSQLVIRNSRWSQRCRRQCGRNMGLSICATYSCKFLVSSGPAWAQSPNRIHTTSTCWWTTPWRPSSTAWWMDGSGWIRWTMTKQALSM